ncbi:phytoene desaturase family protein [Amycolatopsis jejuensis]|uniref:phytoene desaturase family protein n=1 Tax=Amycolatopsis jejuensis TaxID=330084 RepID=UPI0005260760|nr:NAD(P)/FAD-dependent oxidoreductase [Amycolatopsis jejuensis]
MHEVDAVVIGAGHQGLVAATTLAEAGLEVLVVEAEPEIGGAVRSGEPIIPGYVHDLFATNMNLFLGSPFHARYGDELRDGGLRFATSRHPYASAFPDGASLRVTSDPDATLAMWRDHSAADAEGWQRLREVFDAFSSWYLPVYTQRQPSRSLVSAARTIRSGRKHGYSGEWASLLVASSRTLGERYFASPEAKALLAAWGMHLDYAPDIAGGAVFPLLECFLDMINGMSLVEGGAGRLPAALERLLERRGGQVRTGSAVERLEAAGAVRVHLADGTSVRARRGVVSTALVPQLARMLGPAAPAPMVRAGRDYRFGPGTFMLHLALSGPVPWQDPRLAESAYVHLGGYVDDMALVYQQALSGLLPEKPLLVVGQTSVVDPTRVPREGHQVAWIQVRMVPGMIRGDAAGRIAARTWDEAREPFADRVLDLLERHAPAVRDVVLGVSAHAPPDLERANRNLVGGDSVSGSHHLDQFLLMRPSLELSRYRSGVPGLFLAGAGTWPGAGVNAVSGELAAKALLKSAHRRPWTRSTSGK